MKPTLARSEWLAVLGIASLLFCLTAIHYASRPSSLPESPPIPVLTLSIEGAVAAPGIYTLAPGSRLRDLLNLAEPTGEADLSNISPRRELCDGEAVTIASKRYIRVFVEGAVPHPRPYTVEEGTTVGQLLRGIELSEEAVTYSLRKREVLKEGQTLQVPRRQRRRN